MSWAVLVDVLPGAVELLLAERLGRKLLVNCLSEWTALPTFAVEPRRRWLLADSMLKSRSPRARCIIGLREGRHADIDVSDFARDSDGI